MCIFPLFFCSSSKAVVPDELSELFPTSGQSDTPSIAVNIRDNSEGDGKWKMENGISRSSPITDNIIPEIIPIIGHRFQARPKDERQVWLYSSNKIYVL